jgi:hypothetical protein
VAPLRGRNLEAVDRKARRRLLRALDHEAFELLVHELLVAEHKDEATALRKLRPPDGGADSLTLCWEGQPAEVIQAKHSPDRPPDWVDWEHSLDAAVENWAPSRVTFACSNDFTGPQLRTFAERLGGRHRGVCVEALTLTDLERLLDDHPHIAPRFLGPEAGDLRRAVERAAKLGGAELETSTDLIARAGELADFADEQDPRFEYEQTLGRRAPRWEELPYMTVMEEPSTETFIE